MTDQNRLLKLIAEKGYDVAFGVRKTFATYDIVNKGPGWIGFISSAIGVFALIYDPLSAKLPSAMLVVAGIVSLYLSFYRADEYEKAAIAQLTIYNRLRSLYFSVQSGEDFAAAKAKLDAIEGDYGKTTVSRQVFLSGWYGHYKLFAETQYGWMDEQLHFTWKDKVPFSARAFAVALVFAVIGGVAWASGTAHRFDTCGNGQPQARGPEGEHRVIRPIGTDLSKTDNGQHGS